MVIGTNIAKTYRSNEFLVQNETHSIVDPDSLTAAKNTMADFSDKQDKRLVRLALEYELLGKRIDWNTIAAEMTRCGGFPPSKLKNRLKTLRNRYKTPLYQFPRRYFVDYSDAASESRGGTMSRSTVIPPFPAREAYLIIDEIFSSIKLSDIRQVKAHTESNAGEIAPVGVTSIIEACKLRNDDVFLDVGSGIGNVVAQIAIQTGICCSIGIEIREDIANLGKQLMQRMESRYPRLARVHVLTEDIRNVDIHGNELIQKVSILYSHNTLFTPEAALALETMCCNLPKLRIVVLQDSFCHRHRASCVREFCAKFEIQETVTIPVTFRKESSFVVVNHRK